MVIYNCVQKKKKKNGTYVPKMKTVKVQMSASSWSTLFSPFPLNT